jgi:hypothetical protein
MVPLWHTRATSVNMYAEKAYNDIFWAICKLSSGQYENDEDLENQIYDLAAEMSSEADAHNGFIECHFPTPPMQTLQQQDSPTAKENIPSSD